MAELYIQELMNAQHSGTPQLPVVALLAEHGDELTIEVTGTNNGTVSQSCIIICRDYHKFFERFSTVWS